MFKCLKIDYHYCHMKARVKVPEKSKSHFYQLFYLVNLFVEKLRLVKEFSGVLLHWLLFPMPDFTELDTCSLVSLPEREFLSGSTLEMHLNKQCTTNYGDFYVQ